MCDGVLSKPQEVFRKPEATCGLLTWRKEATSEPYQIEGLSFLHVIANRQSKIVNHMYDEFFAKAHELTQAGVPFVTATVVRAEKPTSAKPGDKAIVTTDGVMHGWIGGSCAQPTVIKEALRSLAEDKAQLIRLSTDPESQTPRDGVLDMPMTCFSGGTLEIYIEPQYPRPQLLIVGNLPVAQALAHLGSAMSYGVVAVDLEGDGVAMSHADAVVELDELVARIRPYSYIIIATHGNYDEMALTKILPTKPSYVGLVASPRRAEAVRAYLIEQGFSDADLFPLKAPAGLDIQARRGDEIALSIMAEIVQKRRNAELMEWALLNESQVETTGETPTPTIAMDPICQMEVQIDTAKYTHEYDGQTYYFCCAGCQSTFAKDPVSYLEKQGRD